MPPFNFLISALCFLSHMAVSKTLIQEFSVTTTDFTETSSTQVRSTQASSGVPELESADAEQPTKTASFESLEERTRDYVTEGCVLLSFMLLRSMVALRSLDYTSHELLWGGIAFAVLTRCISEGLVTRSCEVPGLGALIAIATREAFHVYGLRLVLDNFLVTEC